MKKISFGTLSAFLMVAVLGWSTPSSLLAQAAGGNNATPANNVNNTGGVVNGQGTATSGSASSSTSGGNSFGGSNGNGMTSSGATTHVNTAAGDTPGSGNGGVTNTPPSGVTPGTGASPNPTR